jgi:hypothetical protein
MKSWRITLIALIIGVLGWAAEASAQTRKGKPAPQKSGIAGKKKKKVKKAATMTTLTGEQWGGQGIGLNRRDGGGFTLEFDCAQGEIPQAVALDATGKFEVKGVFKPERPGPVRMDDPDRSQAVVYYGQVTGKTMTLHIRLPEGKEVLGPFKLQAGVWPRITRCL